MPKFLFSKRSNNNKSSDKETISPLTSSTIKTDDCSARTSSSSLHDEMMDQSTEMVTPVDRRALFRGTFDSISTSFRKLMQTSAAHLLVNDQRDVNDTVLEAKAKKMIQQLSSEELEIAASSNYEYLKTMHASTSYTKAAAFPMVYRYLVAKKGDPKVALTKLKSTLQFRKHHDVAGLMRAFDGDVTRTNNDDCSSKLHHHLSSQKIYVQGYDKDGRATFIFKPRLVQEHDLEWTLKEALYTMERAIACSARRQESADINAIVDCKGFSAWKHAPPMEIGKQFMLALRHHYAGHVHKIFILDAPKSFSVLWKMVQPFIGTSTKSKIVFVQGKHKDSILGEHYTPDQASSWMLSNGEMPDDVNVEEYLYKIPFDRAACESN